VSPRRGRTRSCDQADARTRFSLAQKFIEVAGIVEGEADPDFWSVAASLAVLAGIAAADAASCKALGRRSRGEDHHDAETLLESIVPDGGEAAVALRRLIDLKDKAQYGIIHVSRADLKTAMKQAARVLEFAEGVLRR